MNVKTLKQQLDEKGMCDDGLLGLGNQVSGVLVGAMAGLAGMQAITKSGNYLVVTPFKSKEILFDKAVRYDKKDIKTAKVGGFLSKNLKIQLADGTKLKFPLTQGAGDVKKMLSALDLNKK